MHNYTKKCLYNMSQSRGKVLEKNQKKKKVNNKFVQNLGNEIF